ncbi:hypothetical protein ACJX0J_039351, partial [Zea mays]
DFVLFYSCNILSGKLCSHVSLWYVLSVAMHFMEPFHFVCGSEAIVSVGITRAGAITELLLMTTGAVTGKYKWIMLLSPASIAVAWSNFNIWKIELYKDLMLSKVQFVEAPQREWTLNKHVDKLPNFSGIFSKMGAQ